MSDDIPLLFASELAKAVGPQRRAVFLSAMSAPQMQQYATAGWQVFAGPGFESAATCDLATVPASTCTVDQLQGADLISLEAPTWPSDAVDHFRRWMPHALKVNAAFHGVEDAHAERIAEGLQRLGYDVIGCHWRDDNTFGLRSLTRIDRLTAFGAPDWKHMNLIGLRDAETVRRLLVVARLYTGEERRIAELRLSHEVRGDHIRRLEDAMTTLQKRMPAG